MAAFKPLHDYDDFRHIFTGFFLHNSKCKSHSGNVLIITSALGALYHIYNTGNLFEAWPQYDIKNCRVY